MDPGCSNQTHYQTQLVFLHATSVIAGSFPLAATYQCVLLVQWANIRTSWVQQLVTIVKVTHGLSYLNDQISVIVGAMQASL
jgi:hypothetical protein